jgi:thioredoxin 1
MTDKNEIIKHPKTNEEFEKIIASGKPVLVDYFATWCGPCQMMGPILEDMAKNYKNIDKIEIVKVDIDELRKPAEKYNIMSVPTFMLFKDGKDVETMVGMRSQEVLEEKLDKLIG